MNFFEHQDRAKSQSRKLLWLLSLTLLVIVIAVDSILLMVAGFSADIYLNPYHLLQPDFLSQHWKLLTIGAIVTTACIGLSSLYKITSLRAGGGKVARDLGGVLLDFDTSDPARRRLRNVVEEIALASGMPVPDIYILETESAINAFAAGYSTADAAIVVTRGTVEQLERNELQGVIAHEFSHILNGDMRLNIRIMGLLYGIMVLTIIGHTVYPRRRRRTVFGGSRTYSRHQNNYSVYLAGAGLLAVGYIGVFLTRAIKASISRQREYLADASAVQFTRDTSGISGALQKIAATPHSKLMVNSEEISHMLFEAGKTAPLFFSRFLASHPPTLDRIKRIEPGFRSQRLDELSKKMARTKQYTEQTLAKPHSNLSDSDNKTQNNSATFADANHIIDEIGQPPTQTILYAAGLAAALPQVLKSAAHSTRWAPSVVLALLLDRRQEILVKQQLIIAEILGADTEQQIQAFSTQVADLTAEQRLPMLELAFPALKRQPDNYLQRYLKTVEQLIHADGRVDVFEYACAKLLRVYLHDAMQPTSATLAGKRSIQQCKQQVSELLLMLAWKGHESNQQVRTAYLHGMSELNLKQTEKLRLQKNWHEQLDNALLVLDQLTPSSKQALIKAMLAVCWHDQRLDVREAELLRVIAAALHTPLPMLNSNAKTSHIEYVQPTDNNTQTLKLRA